MRMSVHLVVLLAFIAAPALARQAQAPYSPDNPRPGSARANLRRLMQERPGEPMPANRSALDAALIQDPGAAMTLLLGQKDPVQIYLDLDWERARIYDGAGLAISLAYMMDLWRVAPVLPADPKINNGDTPDALRETAVAFALYNTALIKVDSARCADASAPSHRFDQLVQIAKPIFVYGRGLPDAKKTEVIGVAINVERATAPARKDDPVLCSGGMAEIQQGLAANGNAPLAQATVPGTVGQTLAVPATPGYKPGFTVPEVWQPQQTKQRDGLLAEFDTALGLQTGKTPASTSDK